MTSEGPKEQLRDLKFAERTVTRIWQEEPSAANPYLADGWRCHGYDIVELASKKSFVEVLFLLLTGELPSQQQTELLNAVMVAFINPGPRHAATRAAMNAGVGKTFGTHILPIGLAVLGGRHLGGEEVTEAMRFFRTHRKNAPALVAAELLDNTVPPSEGDHHLAPGFGCRFGGIDPMPGKIARFLGGLPASGDTIRWGADFAAAITPHGMGWLAPGVCAAAFCDLGLHYRDGAGLFQLLSAPGLLAHGLELSNKPTTAMPFLDEEHYVIAPEARTRKA